MAEGCDTLSCEMQCCASRGSSPPPPALPRHIPPIPAPEAPPSAALGLCPVV